ncbi:hypothetical protein A2U01_0021624, partial [Trifolium medium]|nr:hypothetical protein [Trifolium medium]
PYSTLRHYQSDESSLRRCSFGRQHIDSSVYILNLFEYVLEFYSCRFYVQFRLQPPAGGGLSIFPNDCLTPTLASDMACSSAKKGELQRVIGLRA